MGDSGCFHSHGGGNGRELRVAPAGGPSRLAALPLPAQAPAPAAHYLLGCRYWCVNMLSSLSNQPALFLQRNGYLVAVTADNK